jgi:hypothetical protein
MGEKFVRNCQNDSHRPYPMNPHSHSQRTARRKARPFPYYSGSLVQSKNIIPRWDSNSGLNRFVYGVGDLMGGLDSPSEPEYFVTPTHLFGRFLSPFCLSSSPLVMDIITTLQTIKIRNAIPRILLILSFPASLSKARLTLDATAKQPPS